MFIGIPFIVRTVQPVLSDIETELEEAASALGANRWQTITKIILPILLPALFTGFALAFARGVGEYGSVFIAGNQPFKTEIAPLMIISRLEEYDYAGATTIAAVMLVLFSLFYLSLTYFKHGQTVVQEKCHMNLHTDSNALALKLQSRDATREPLGYVIRSLQLH